ncbi:HNH endonuclease domain-containing protein [Mycolicibacterium sp. CR10]|uniref:HNH endonuclease domain-containing protein n=1 Tax=Mycolicibacterium sp. CR10 TaxID=2562314 RepID=UPI0010C019C8|nr:HNH endonuclease domain-containing protein [Mycolicibacterium sp. CR10]
MARGDAVARFAYELPSLDSYWRAIVLFGQNVASYKFALAGALLEIGADAEIVTLDMLALPFATRVAEHLRTHDKQGTFQKSQFLDACRAFNTGELGDDGLRAKTVRLGFQNVIDAFHVVDQAEVPERSFIDERKNQKGIRITDHLRELLADGHGPNLREEAEARWRLVETAWELNLPRHLLTVEFEPDTATLLVPRRRTNITGARAALNGYQKGHCFYCYTAINIAGSSATTCHVDHVFPWSAGPLVGGAPVDGVWNLVLACARCNGWHEKSDRPPHQRYVERLNIRNDYLISSHHPLRPTLIEQTGQSPSDRSMTLKRALDQVSVRGARAQWVAPEELEAGF